MTSEEENQLAKRVEARLSRLLAPLMEQIDASEQATQAYREKCNVLSAQLEAKSIERHEAQLVEARKRFRAGIIVSIIQGQLSSNTFSWDKDAAEVADAVGLADLILKECDLR